MSKPARPTPNLVITEGKNDKFVFHHLLAHHGIAEGIIAFQEFDGISRLLEGLPEQLKISGLERLGVVIDADTDLSARWDALKHIFTQAGYQQIPRQPLPEGTILLHTELPKVGVWLMPDNQLPGALEDFVSFLVPANDPLWTKAGDCLSNVTADQRRFNSLAKAHFTPGWLGRKNPARPWVQLSPNVIWMPTPNTLNV
jgi:hypothetical protein